MSLPKTTRRSAFFFSFKDYGQEHSKPVAILQMADDDQDPVYLYLTSRKPWVVGLIDPHAPRKKKEGISKPQKRVQRAGSLKRSPTSEVETVDGPTVVEFDQELIPCFVPQGDGYSSRMYISGASLCGKSFMASILARSYAEQFPEHRVYIFSENAEDASYQSLKKFIETVVVKPSPKLIEPPLEVEEMANSLVIFDDWEGPDKKVNDAMEKIKNELMNRGRHHRISVMVCRQIAFQNLKTKAELTNSFGVIFYPQSGGLKAYIGFMKSYLGFSTRKIDEVNAQVGDSRWVYVSRTAPIYFLHEHGAFLITS